MTDKKKESATNKEKLWAEAKKRCRLNNEDIRLAKEMGLNPRSLIKNIPAKSQPWKSPVKVWIRDLYEKRQSKAAKKKARKGQATVAVPKQQPQESVVYPVDEATACEEWKNLPDSGEIQSQDQLMRRRQEQFRNAAGYLADKLSAVQQVQKVVLFGSVAKPLKKEIPRFAGFRRRGIVISHECKDVDIAVWVTELSCLRTVQKARSQALNRLLSEKQIGVAHHQVDLFIMEPETNRYLGRLCTYSACPKGKEACGVDGCGAVKFLKQHEDFVFATTILDDPANTIFFER
jgi:hypothetical protein